jgi:hypothetical protein
MVHYKCTTCAKVFNHRGNYQQHLNRKKPCSIDVASCSTENVISQPTKNTCSNSCSIDEKNKYNCKFCQKNFKHHSSLYRHQNYFCKNNTDDSNKDEIIKSLITELKTIKQQMNITNTNSHNTSNNSHNTNNTTNNNIQINLVPYGKENYDFIPVKQWISYFNSPHNCIPRITKDVHFNPEYPEYQNVFVSNINGKYVNVYDGKWKKFTKKTFIEKFINNKAFILIDKFDELDEDNKLAELTKKRFEKFKEWDLNEKLVKGSKEDVIHELYNNKTELEV